MGYTALGEGDFQLVLTANQTTTSDSATGITDLVFSAKANSVYMIIGSIHHGCNNTGGVKLGCTIPSGATMHLNLNGSTTSSAAYLWQPDATSGALTAAFCTENNANRGVFIGGTITIGATAGDVQLIFASGVNAQTSTIYKEGTSILIQKVS